MIYLLVKLMDNTVLVGAAETDDGDEIVLRDCRMVVYWSQDVKGMPGLCANGPTKGCRVSPAADLMRIPKAGNVRFCARMTDKAWTKFEEEPWG